MNGIVADIQRCSFHDGFGIRTTVFLKGCPLCCQWCHNPECIAFEKQMMLYPEKCIQCGACEQGCYSGAKVLCGKEYSPETLLDQLLEDKDYYGDDGGVTFSGGEPLAQKNFLEEMLFLCKKENIGCAVETSLYLYDKNIFQNVDFVMADLKIWDTNIHKQYTGVYNDNIKEHFKMLNELDVPIIARTPVIPEINQQIDKISGFLKELENVVQYELLPYHPLGVTKQKALGMDEKKFSVPSRAYMKELEKYAYIR